MSAQALVASPVFPLIKTSVFECQANTSNNITFVTPFPLGALPLVFIQNTDGGQWPNVIFSTQNLSNTGFTLVQSGTGSPAAVLLSYLAVWCPTTPPPP
jgi:hypothetical protein